MRRATIIALGLALSAPAALALNLGAKDVALRVQASPAVTRVILEFATPSAYQVRKEEGRVVLSLQGDFRAIPYKTKNFDDPLLSRFKLDRGSRRTDLLFYTGPEFGAVTSFEMSAPFRLVLEFRRRAEAGGAASAARSATPTAPVPTSPAPAPADGARAPEPPLLNLPPAPTPVPTRPPGIQVIVVDAGHGGGEIGARGPSGLLEKEVTLDMARRLQAGLEKRLGVKVIMTRDSDRQVSLDDRTAIANHERADLFLSIHCNASPATEARGAETYFLSYQATDDAARRTAALENNTLGVETPPEDPGLGMVLWNLAQAQYLAESSRLAERIQENLNALLRIESRGVKQAPFKVLMGATMPAVLVEIGFITHPDEEKKLKDGAYREQIAAAIIDSVAAFKERAEKQLGLR